MIKFQDFMTEISNLREGYKNKEVPLVYWKEDQRYYAGIVRYLIMNENSDFEKKLINLYK